MAGSIFAAAREAALDLEALLLPVTCLVCDRPGEAVCEWCMGRLRRVVPPLCRRCGQPLEHWERGSRQAGMSAGACGFCQDWPAALAWARSAVVLDETARTMVHALKYEGWIVVAGAMGRAMRCLEPALKGADVLVPVPLGTSRLRERGHNQAAELADALGSLTGLSVDRQALERRRETRSQTDLDPQARRRNVAGAFHARDAGIRGGKVVVVDDVLTTGATLCAAAEALMVAGAVSVGAVTFARTSAPATCSPLPASSNSPTGVSL